MQAALPYLNIFLFQIWLFMFLPSIIASISYFCVLGQLHILLYKFFKHLTIRSHTNGKKKLSFILIQLFNLFAWHWMPYSHIQISNPKNLYLGYNYFHPFILSTPDLTSKLFFYQIQLKSNWIFDHKHKHKPKLKNS